MKLTEIVIDQCVASQKEGIKPIVNERIFNQL
jgi:hypothetical protein